MKKNNIFILCIILSLLPFTSKGFFENNNSIDIYSTIEKGIDDLEIKSYTFEATRRSEKSLSEEINTFLKGKNTRECIESGLSFSDMKKIKGGDIVTLDKYIKPECKSEDGDIAGVDIGTYQKTIAKFDNEVLSRSEHKSSQIYEISKIGIYSDGSTENSPFDLINDIHEIEKIIFGEKFEYNGVEDSNFNNSLKDYLLGKLLPKKTQNPSSDSSGGSDIPNTGSTSTEGTNIFPLNIPPSVGSSPYICTDINTLIDSSGLSDTTIKTLTGSGKINTSSGSSSSSSSPGNSGGPLGNTPYPNTGYKKVNDNSIWPCNDFFCITVEFIIKRQKLLGGSECTSIKSIMEKSNEHLKKFANTSLVGSKMTTNNFELGLLNLSLPDIFHMGVQIQKRSPPILNIESDEGKEDMSEFAGANMLFEQFKNDGRDYTRENDIYNFKSFEEELKTVTECSECSYKKVQEMLDNLRYYRVTMSAKNSIVSRTIDAKAGYDDSETTFKEMIEVEKFTGALRDYVMFFSGIIKKMNEIPQAGN